MWIFSSGCQTDVNAPNVTEVKGALLFQRTGIVQIFRLNAMQVRVYNFLACPTRFAL
jgi:hypothetical protein